MKKFLILIIAIPFLAASCDGDIFNFGNGTRGVFKSEDNGESFSAAVKLSPKGDIGNFSINSIALDPVNPDILYVASSSGIYKSENAAENYKYILSGISVAAVVVDPTSPATVYAAGIVGQNGKILKSVDAGTSWVDIYNEPSKNNTVLSIAVVRNNSSIVLAGLNTGELIRSTDAGRTWQTTEDFGDRVIQIKFGSFNNAYGLTSTKGLFRSSDLGVTWSSITNALTADTLNSISQNVSSVSNFYDLAIDHRQAGVLYLGTEQGIFRSINDGTNWSFLPLPVRDSALRVTALSVSPISANNLIAAVASTVYKSINGGLTWETKVLPTSAVVRMIVINPQSTNIIYLGLRTQ